MSDYAAYSVVESRMVEIINLEYGEVWVMTQGNFVAAHNWEFQFPCSFFADWYGITPMDNPRITEHYKVCNCEHTEHFNDEVNGIVTRRRKEHEYFQPIAKGARTYTAEYVGLICEECALGHMAEYTFDEYGHEISRYSDN